MIKKLEEFKFETKHITYLSKKIPWRGEDWKSQAKEMIALKKYIHSKLEKIQDNECAYCGLALKETSESQIEHIAPKGSDKLQRYPQFTFKESNLVLACTFCNGFSMKGTYDTLIKVNSDYSKCEFNIVHPYFDDPSDYYSWANPQYKTIIQYRSDKGKNSIKIFQLSSDERTEARAKQYVLSTVENKSLLNDILDFKG
ncbi:hypothetical protein [Exiguobacterium mexicanum]|uniref:hypothetical protein n=1 Tax=Exiguobacterium mexicanum TaxID=340146 RepID=UPI0037C1013F